MANRHSGQVRGHAASGGAPGSKHYYRPVMSFSQWDQFVETRAIGSVLQVCCGGSRLGQVRVDIDCTVPGVTVCADMLALPFRADAFDTIAADPMYNLAYPTRVHLQRELARIARRRILFKAPWVMRAAGWRLVETLLLASHTCANVAVLSVLDRVPALAGLFDA